MKSQIFNLIILDESGSMDCVTRQTIGGCNETINTIKSVQEKYPDTQEHFVSIYTFQGFGNKPSRYLIKNVPIAEVKHITEEDYTPCGNTPLYDAIGSTLTDLTVATKKSQDATGSVTIITDGWENSSKNYSLGAVARMISALKEIGWNINIIGANIDVERVSRSLNIDNAMAFDQDERGTQDMFAKERRSREAYYGRFEARKDELDLCYGAYNDPNTSEEDRQEYMERIHEIKRETSNGYFAE